jgi:DNA-binding NarL/FixJ family response regulator
MLLEMVTPSERAALLAICQPGAKESSAAQALGISVGALRSRLRRLYSKLGVNSAAQAAYRLGLSAGPRRQN